jgi:hypothetical protein
MQEYGQCIEFFHGLPQDKTVQDFISDFPGQQKLIVLDDLMEKASNRPDVAALFTHGRHEHISVCIFTRASTFVTRHLIMITQSSGTTNEERQIFKASLSSSNCRSVFTLVHRHAI